MSFDTEKRRLRFNFANINEDKIRKNAQGGIIVQGAIIRTGVFEYETENGGIVHEFLPASELFKKSVLETLENAPVTNDHPNDMVNPNNFKHNAIGFVRNVRKEKNKFVVADLIINDSETIDQILSGEKRELSAGYYTEPVKKKGISPEGERYDVVQTNILFNHCSVVERGRCGPDVSLRLNSNGNQEMRMSASQTILKPKSGNGLVDKERKNVIREVGEEFCVFSKDGDRNFGCYKTREEAEERLKEIHAFAENSMADKTNEHKEEKRNAEEVFALMTEVQDNLGITYEELIDLLLKNREGLIAMLRDELENESDGMSGEEAMNDAEKKKDAKSATKQASKLTKAEREAEEKFNERVNKEVEARIGLLVAAKQLGVKDLKPSIPAEQLRLQIVQTAKPHLSLDGKSDDYVQALLEDSLSGVDIDSFWVTPEKDLNAGEASSKSSETIKVEDNDSEFDDFDGAPDDVVPQSEMTLNSLLKTVRSKNRANDIGGNSSKDDIYGSVEERARMLLNWRGKKLV